MSDLFRDVSPEDADLQPIIEGLFGEYGATATISLKMPRSS